MRVIANDLFANAVRIEGNPSTGHVGGERLRNEGADMVLVSGCKYMIFSKGIFPGESFNRRAMWLGTHLSGSHMSQDTILQVSREKKVYGLSLRQSAPSSVGP
ncbi:hypothetical protein EYZ11_011644 [Aspergillus tanneri]|uniref:Uncharacterized protein n=1 Tax=Aspergillus tanneri TaxID=1220188 RepID=A0A4S3J2L4_9EURO|nr:hypothetical protein EYZ11_011644 [Aspergillus tanneri]